MIRPADRIRTTDLLPGFIVAFFVFGLASGACASAPTEDDEERLLFVIGNIAFVLAHEFSHLVIDDYEIPVLGNSEDAADTLAAVSLIRLDRARPEKNYAYIRMLLSAADGNRILWETGLERDNPDTYGARHPLSIQRVSRIVCLVYGSNMDTFAPLASASHLPAFRADWCDLEFENAEKAWLWVRDTYIRKAEPLKLVNEVDYGNTKDPAEKKIRERLIEARILERSMAVVEETILLREPFTLRTRSCGSPDAYWDSEKRDIVLCYELVRWFDKVSSDQRITELAERIREFNRDN